METSTSTDANVGRLLAALSEAGIAIQKFDHPAVFTCEEAQVHLGHVPGVGTKNLFLKTEKGNGYWLVSVPEDKRVDLKALGKELGIGKVSFASDVDLRRLLGVEPGAVTLMGVMNDINNEVSVVIDVELSQAQALQCHPLVNTSTVVLDVADLIRFLARSNHAPKIIDVPRRG